MTERPWDELASSGLLWLINATCFHPRGYALAVHPDGAGWSLLGDGSEPWCFPDGEITDAKFWAAQSTLNGSTPG